MRRFLLVPLVALATVTAGSKTCLSESLCDQSQRTFEACGLADCENNLDSCQAQLTRCENGDMASAVRVTRWVGDSFIFRPKSYGYDDLVAKAQRVFDVMDDVEFMYGDYMVTDEESLLDTLAVAAATEDKFPEFEAVFPTAISDGGWTLVASIIGAETTWGFSSPLWTNDELLNEEAQLQDGLVNAKYETFISQPFNGIKMCVGSPKDNCVEHQFTRNYASAQWLFNAGYIRDSTLDQEGIIAAFGATGQKDCAMQRPGFNIQCNDGNKARWGYCTNLPDQACQPTDAEDADAAIGIGIAGQATSTELGAGTTYYWSSGSGPSQTNNVWAWVIPTPVEKIMDNDWTLVATILGDGTMWGYSSDLWTSDNLLNWDNTVDDVEDAKFEAFNFESFTKIRMCVDAAKTNCVEHEFDQEYALAQALFSAGYVRDATLDQEGIIGAFGATGQKDCEMQRPGFNIECNDGNKARWGYCTNLPDQACQPDDANDADAAIGIGIAGQATSTELGA